MKMKIYIVIAGAATVGVIVGLGFLSVPGGIAATVAAAAAIRIIQIAAEKRKQK